MRNATKIKKLRKLVSWAGRRERDSYPDLKPGEFALMKRRECGTNISLQQFGKPDQDGRRIALPRRVLKEAFVFTRQEPVQSRSGYRPHVGAKQRSKARTVLAAAGIPDHEILPHVRPIIPSLSL